MSASAAGVSLPEIERPVVVVAHPDDETLFCGGWLAENPRAAVICASVPERDPERIGHFFEACGVLGVKGYVVGSLARQGEIDTTLIEIVAHYYEAVITHNDFGEYGHIAHMAMHEAMKSTGLPMWVFGYGIEAGEPIDVGRKRAAMRKYVTRPGAWKNQSKNFDLSRECLIPS